jgi:hypothetical protein
MQLTNLAAVQLVALAIAFIPCAPLLLLALKPRRRAKRQSRGSASAAVHNPQWRELCRLSRIVHQ